MLDTDVSTAPAEIVCTPGGRPRLQGHRLDIDWYASIRREYGSEANSYIKNGWPYLRDDQIQAISDYYDAHRREYSWRRHDRRPTRTKN